MSTYLAAWAILPASYGRLHDDIDEPKVSVSQPSIPVSTRFISVHSMGET